MLLLIGHETEIVTESGATALLQLDLTDVNHLLYAPGHDPWHCRHRVHSLFNLQSSSYLENHLLVIAKAISADDISMKSHSKLTHRFLYSHIGIRQSHDPSGLDLNRLNHSHKPKLDWIFLLYLLVIGNAWTLQFLASCKTCFHPNRNCFPLACLYLNQESSTLDLRHTQ